MTDRTHLDRDRRLAELARRVLAGEPIDWDAAMEEDPSIVAELRRLQHVVAVAGESTRTAVEPPPAPQPDGIRRDHETEAQQNHRHENISRLRTHDFSLT